MTKKLKLIHLANFNSTNIGNGALIKGLENVFSDDFSKEIDWIYEAWDDYTFGFKDFDQEFVKFVNKCDGLVVNGAVAIHGRKYLERTGMRFELTCDLMKKIQKPVVFYGISYRHFHGQVFHHAETLKKTFKFMTERPDVFLGVRNDGTKKWLERTLRLEKKNLNLIHEIPDTGIFTPAEIGYYPEVLKDRPVIIFSPNDEDTIFRYGSSNIQYVKKTGYMLSENENSKDNSWVENRKELIENLKKSLTQILRETHGQLLLVPHYLDDYRFITDLIDRFESQIAHQCAITTGLMRVPGTSYFFGRYKKANISISMRVHSMSPCIGLGVPMIPLVTQPRMWDFLKTIGLEDIGVDAFSTYLENNLFQNTMKVLANPEKRIERFFRAKRVMREQLRSINSEIEKMFDG